MIYKGVSIRLSYRRYKPRINLQTIAYFSPSLLFKNEYYNDIIVFERGFSLSGVGRSDKVARQSEQAQVFAFRLIIGKRKRFGSSRLFIDLYTGLGMKFKYRHITEHFRGSWSMVRDGIHDVPNDPDNIYDKTELNPSFQLGIRIGVHVKE